MSSPLCKRIKEKRREKGFKSQQDFADRIGVTRVAVQRWESDKADPDLDKLISIADILECDIDYLIGKIDCSTHGIQYIHDQTGLSESAILLLQKWNASEDRKKLWPEYLTKIITDERYYDLMEHITDMMCHAHIEGLALKNGDGSDAIEEINNQAAQEWYISHVLGNILENMTHEERTKHLNK